jgi:hypothetical protein
MSEPTDWNQDEEALAEVYRRWQTEDLVRAVTADAAEYTPEALRRLRQELARRDVAAEEQQAVAEQEKERGRKLVGIRGWLGFFLLLLGSNSLRVLWIFFPLAVTPGMAPLLRAYMLGRVALGVLGIAACVLLVARTRRTPQWAAAWLILNMILGVASIAFTGDPLSAASPLLAGALWLSYLSMSKRVKATYGEAPDEDEPDLSFPPDPAQEGNPYAPPGSRRADQPLGNDALTTVATPTESHADPSPTDSASAPL